MLNKILNLEKNPFAIFYVVVPLVLLAFGALFWRAVLEIKLHHDYGFLIIDLLGLALLIFALFPLLRFLLQEKRAKAMKSKACPPLK